MTDTLITQCPHCQTRFHLKRSQLDAAQGSVRCGACLQSFNAISQLSVETARPAVQQTIKPSPSISIISRSEPNTQAIDSNKESAITDPSITPNRLDNLELDHQLNGLAQEQQHAHQLLTERLKSRLSAADQASSLHNTSIETLNDWSHELFVEEPMTATPLANEAVAKARLQTPVSPTERRSDTSQAPLQEEPITPRVKQLEYFSDEPLRLDWRSKKKPWKRRLAWGLANALALLLLVGQYTYNNFTQLARDDNTRPWLAALCPLLDCQLPAKVDVKKIKSSNLVVRKHPEFSAALLVDAIIYNRAAFSQPFPLLELTFSDSYGKPLAKRLFKPTEYLSGELAGQSQMPPQTPIHIALEILEGKGGAANYSLNFVSPD